MARTAFPEEMLQWLVGTRDVKSLAYRCGGSAGLSRGGWPDRTCFPFNPAHDHERGHLENRGADCSTACCTERALHRASTQLPKHIQTRALAVDWSEFQPL
jgi:hypothetical protein